MTDLTTRKTFGKAGGGLAAVLTAAAMLVASAAAQAQSVAAVPDYRAAPDPAIAKGLDVFTDQGEMLGKLREVVQREGRMFGILAIRDWPTETPQMVEVPYEALRVADGRLTYNVDSNVNDPIKRNANDFIDWEPLHQRVEHDEWGR